MRQHSPRSSDGAQRHPVAATNLQYELRRRDFGCCRPNRDCRAVGRTQAREPHGDLWQVAERPLEGDDVCDRGRERGGVNVRIHPAVVEAAIGTEPEQLRFGPAVRDAIWYGGGGCSSTDTGRSVHQVVISDVRGVGVEPELEVGLVRGYFDGRDHTWEDRRRTEAGCTVYLHVWGRLWDTFFGFFLCREVGVPSSLFEAPRFFGGGVFGALLDQCLVECHSQLRRVNTARGLGFRGHVHCRPVVQKQALVQSRHTGGCGGILI